jgi:hypothetical protein
MTRYWTPVERNQRIIGFPAILLLNRALWFAVAVSVLAVLHRRFRFAHIDGRVGPHKSAPGGRGAFKRQSLVNVPQIARSLRAARLALSQTLAVARESLVEVTSGRVVSSDDSRRHWPDDALGLERGGYVFDTSTWPVTHLVAGKLLSERIGPFPG